MSLSTHLQYCTFTTIAQLVTVGKQITSARTARSFSEIIILHSEITSTTLPSQNLANVMYVYVNHPPFEIWPRIRSSISFSVYQNSHLQVERHLTSMFMRQNRLFFPSISWFRTRTSHYNVLSCDTDGASSTNVFTPIAYPYPNNSGAHSTWNTVLATRK